MFGRTIANFEKVYFVFELVAQLLRGTVAAACSATKTCSAYGLG
jgi:hypothetical protein